MSSDTETKEEPHFAPDDEIGNFNNSFHTVYVKTDEDEVASTSKIEVQDNSGCSQTKSVSKRECVIDMTF